MNKKIVIRIVSIVLILGLIIAVLVFKGGNTKTLDLSSLNDKISKMEPYSLMSMEDIDIQTLDMRFEIDQDEVLEVIGKMPLMNVQASMYLVIKAKSDEVDDVYEQIREYALNLENIWRTYLPDQYDLVLHRKQGMVGNYVYLIIGSSASEVEKLIK